MDFVSRQIEIELENEEFQVDTYGMLSNGLITWRISVRLLKQILVKSNWRLHGEGFSLGRNSAWAENPSPVFQTGLGFLGKLAKKSEKIPCNRNGISAQAEKQEIRWLPLRSRSDLSGIKAIK